MQVVRSENPQLPWSVVSEGGTVLGLFISEQLAELAAAAFQRDPLSLIDALLVA